MSGPDDTPKVYGTAFQLAVEELARRLDGTGLGSVLVAGSAAPLGSVHPVAVHSNLEQTRVPPLLRATARQLDLERVREKQEGRRRE